MFIRVSHLFILFTFIVVSLSKVQAQATVRAELDSTQITVGDQLRLHLMIRLEQGSKLINTDISSLTDHQAIEFLRYGDGDTLSNANGTTIYQQTLILTSFDSGYHVLPPIRIDYEIAGRTTTITTNELAITVNDVPPLNDLDLIPNKGIIKEPLRLEDFLPYLIGLIALILIGVLIAYIYNRRQVVVEGAAPEIQLPAYEIALQKLNELEQEQLWQRGKIKAYQTQLSYIVREYLERRYRIPALENTTTEILQRLHHTDFPDQWRSRLTNMLQVADLVKFAKAEPGPEFHQRILTDARELVETTKRRPESLPAEQSDTV